MQELTIITGRLRQAIINKESELNNSGDSLSAYVYGALANVKKHIDLFEEHAKLANVSVIEKAGVIANFEKEAKAIEAEIDTIGK